MPFSTPPAVFARESSPTEEDIKLKAILQAEYVKELWLFLGATIGFLTIIHWTSRLLRLVSRPSRSSKSRIFNQSSDSLEKGNNEQRPSEALPHRQRTGRVSLRRLPAALSSTFRNVAFRTTISIGPSSVMSITEATFIVGYVIALLVWLFISTYGLEIFFFEDRAAVLASSQLPLIVALAGKNNIISFLVGVGHEKLNVLHRASSRACLVLLYVHALVHGVSGLPEKFDLANGWMRWGVAGLTAFTLAAILSVRPMRIYFFEFFLITHIILIAIFLVGGYLHAESRGFGDFIWPALLVWGFDRFLRMSRLIWNNRIWSRKSSEDHHARVELLTHDTVRLTLRRKMYWKPGQHAYVVLPSVSKLPTEAHPFTIASVPYALDGSDGDAEKDVVFLIKGQAGFTKRLREHASKKGASEFVPAYIDGPYGCPPDLRSFATCVLFAGGSGVSYTLPLLMSIVRDARRNDTNCRRAIFVWVVRHPEHIDWISKSIADALLAAPSSLIIEPRIFLTGKKPAVLAELPVLEALPPPSPAEPATPTTPTGESVGHASDVLKGKNSEQMTMLALTAMRVQSGRPDVERLLRDAIDTASGPVSVDVAGPSALASSVRNALTSDLTGPVAVLKGRPSVTMHVETFGMVKG